MRNKFIQLKLQNEQIQYVNPLFITSVLKIEDRCAVYTMDGRSIYPEETVDSVIKKIKESEQWQW